MGQAGWKWFCRKCRNIEYREESPNKCSKCHEWDSFGKVGEDRLDVDMFER